MRAVEDHNVDRPEVEAQQCVKLTGTNRSIGLVALFIHLGMAVLFFGRLALLCFSDFTPLSAVFSPSAWMGAFFSSRPASFGREVAVRRLAAGETLTREVDGRKG